LKYFLTATDGIISGYAGDYYITSAKIERGNSGGPAILIKGKCLLGIPTFVTVGSLEALGRVLDITVLYR
jgi:S1-C subfamily serine protease